MDNNRNREYVYGTNSVYMAIAKNAGNRKIYRLFLNKQRKKTDSTSWIKHQCLKRDIEIQEMDKNTFESFASEKLGDAGACSQGIVLEVSPYHYYNLSQYMNAGLTKKSYLVMLDGITDVGNFGSIIRNCSAFGAQGIVIAKNRSVQLTAKVNKVSAGALEGVKVFRVTNLVRAIDRVKEAGFWVYGAAAKGQAEHLEKVQWAYPALVVLGSEKKGLSRLVAKNCDHLVHIPMSTRMESLNVSVASGIILYTMYRGLQK